ncbi:MAG: hypothetical protein HY461_00115 [Parcubacteria group bacterium]|nr:hypothetical protein [Parcubacteria group bacterium]
MTPIATHSLLRLCRTAIILAAVLLVAVLIKRDLVLSGKLTIEHEFNKPDGFVTEVVPLQRVQTGTNGVKVSQEPVYTTLRYPRPFRTLAATVDFRNDEGLLLEAGPQTESFESYTLQALDHPQLNKLFDSPEVWAASGTDTQKPGQQTQVFQKRSGRFYQSMAELATDLPSKQQSGYYGVPWPRPYIPDLKKANLRNAVAYDIPLQGSHEFYLATAADALRVEIDVQDMNNHAGPDTLTMQLFDWQGNVLAEGSLDDDGSSEADGPTSFKRTVAVEAVGLLQADVYRLQISTTNDIVIRRLAATAPYLVVKGHVAIFGGTAFAAEFGAEGAYPITLITSSRVWTAQTTHRLTAQTIKLGEEALEVEYAFEPYTYRLSRGRSFDLDKGYALTLEKGNITIDGRGVFAFDQEGFFSPVPWLIDESADIDVLGLNYVITDYVPPVRSPNGLLSQTMSFDLRQVFAPDKAFRLQFAAPDMEATQSFTLVSARLEYKADPITWRNARQKFSRFFKREILN